MKYVRRFFYSLVSVSLWLFFMFERFNRCHFTLKITLLFQVKTYYYYYYDLLLVGALKCVYSIFSSPFFIVIWFIHFKYLYIECNYRVLDVVRFEFERESVQSKQFLFYFLIIISHDINIEFIGRRREIKERTVCLSLAIFFRETHFSFEAKHSFYDVTKKASDDKIYSLPTTQNRP